MNDLRIEERCGCGAAITVTGSSYRSLAGGGRNAANPRGAEEVAERWRTEHRHEFPPTPATPVPAVKRAAARPGKVQR